MSLTRRARVLLMFWQTALCFILLDDVYACIPVSVYCTGWSISLCHRPSFPRLAPGWPPMCLTTIPSLFYVCYLIPAKLQSACKEPWLSPVASVAFPSQPACILCCLVLNAKVELTVIARRGCQWAPFSCLLVPEELWGLEKVTHLLQV